MSGRLPSNPYAKMAHEMFDGDATKNMIHNYSKSNAPGFGLPDAVPGGGSGGRGSRNLSQDGQVERSLTQLYRNKPGASDWEALGLCERRLKEFKQGWTFIGDRRDDHLLILDENYAEEGLDTFLDSEMSHGIDHDHPAIL